ncbi:MAG TPA: hypothetical protein VEG30_15295 [Terriglobales bacterium]|nr:hypothetical protein [Terriglobales bacterium]
MARLIRFYIPKNFRPTPRSSSKRNRGRILFFPYTHKSFLDQLRKAGVRMAAAKRISSDLPSGA